MPRNSDLNAVSRQWEMLQLLPTKPPGIEVKVLQAKLKDWVMAWLNVPLNAI